MLKLNYDIFIMMTNFGLKHSSHYKAVGYHEYADLINRINKGVQLYSIACKNFLRKEQMDLVKRSWHSETILQKRMFLRFV